MRELNLKNIIEEFESLTKNSGQVQEETLREILRLNGETEYLQNFGLGGRTDVESFKSCIPLVTYKDIEPYIQRIVDGDASPILTGSSIHAMSISTGTSQGKRKFLPFNEEMLRSTIQILLTPLAFVNKEYPIGEGRSLQFLYSSNQFKTKGGLTATTMTTYLYRSEVFKNTMHDIHSQCCSPEEVIFSPECGQSLYCHLLCGLIYADKVQFISSHFAHNIVHAFRTFEQVWEELCADIRQGTLSKRITVPSVREAVLKILTPNPTLADNVHRKCMSLSNWYGVIPELWPNAKFVYGIMTGSMEPYVKKLRHYAGDLPLQSSSYGASEGPIGANVNPWSEPEAVSYAVFPNAGYFEFIPLKGETEVQESMENCMEMEPVGLTEVEVGKEYEIVVTNFAGLYRYRLGDVLKVAGFHNSTPELQYICRSNVLLSITIDKNTEKDLQLAVEEASQLLAAENLELIDFTSYVDGSSDPGHYVIVLELSGNAGDDILGNCCNCLDKAFVDVGYVISRTARVIGPLELRVVGKGTFQRIMDHYLSNGTTMSQFKMPRCIGPSNSGVLTILSSNVVKGCFSTAYG